MEADAILNPGVPAGSGPDGNVTAPVIHFFFIKPTVWMRQEAFPALIRSEIPAVGIDRAEFMPRLCAKFPGSVFCIHVDAVANQDATDWPNFLGSVAEMLIKTRSTILFIARGLSLAWREAVKKLGIHMAFMEVNHTPRLMSSQLHAVASKMNEHSRRRAIRVSCSGLAVFNVAVDSLQVHGTIRDISSSGMAAFVPDERQVAVREGQDLKKLQLKLKGALILLDGTLVAVRRHNHQDIWVVLFRWGDDKRSKLRIQDYISQRLQEEMDLHLR
jgi:hypothetical protein